MRLTLVVFFAAAMLVGCERPAVPMQKAMNCLNAALDSVQMLRCDRPGPVRDFYISLRFIRIPTPPPPKGVTPEKGPPDYFKVLARKDHAVTRVRELKTNAICDVDVRRAYIESPDNEDGFLFVPAVCNGTHTEFVWKLEGEFDLYQGRRSERGF
jgi:hypothetical protein